MGYLLAFSFLYMFIQNQFQLLNVSICWFRTNTQLIHGLVEFCCVWLTISRFRLDWAKRPNNPWVREVLLCLFCCVWCHVMYLLHDVIHHVTVHFVTPVCHDNILHFVTFDIRWCLPFLTMYVVCCYVKWCYVLWHYTLCSVTLGSGNETMNKWKQ